jgi:uncharacterized membrane protein YgcG
MNKITTLLACFFLCVAASAQNSTGTVRGKLVDSLNKQSLKDATVTVLDAKDSSVEVVGLAKEDGSFSLLNITFGEMILQVKFQGYETYSTKITFSATNSLVNLGNIYLKTASHELEGVTVTESVIRMKKDTMEVSASAFKTKPNAVAEDVLRKIPGMEVGKDGTIKSQGETVQRVLVDGKRFFGDDTKMATKNLPPDMIDKIQVFDDMSDQSKFSGFDDGNRIKTINFTTKKDKKKGYFGKAVAGIGAEGIGTDDAKARYDESINLTRMNGDQQITIQGQANNINKQNFTQQNIGGGRGGGGGGFGGGGNSGGITSILAGGINYRDAWSPKIDAYGSYFYNQPEVESQVKSNTTNIMGVGNPDQTIDKLSSSLSKSENHRINFNLEDRIDSMNSLIFRPNVAFQSSNPTSSSSTVTTSGDNKTPINKLESKSSGYSSGYNVNGSNLQLRHRFAKKGRTLSLDLGFSASKTDGDGKNYSENSIYNGTGYQTTIINQYYVDSARSTTFNPTLSYTEPIGKNQMVELRYSYNNLNSTTINNTYRYDPVTQKFSKFDSVFSNSYKYTNATNVANLSYRMQQAKYNFSVGAGFQLTDLTSDNTTKNVVVQRNFLNINPQANFTYNFTRAKSLRVFYNGRPQQPSASQLQPVVTTSDSVSFQVGNPNLQPSFTNSLRVLFSSFDPFTQRVIFATINGTLTQNDIVSVVVPTPGTGGRKTSYVNMNGSYNISGYFNYGFPIKSPKSNLSFQSDIRYSSNRSLLNAETNTTQNTTLAETVKWTTNLANNFDMNLSTTFSVNPIRNSLSPNQNTNYTAHTLAADFTLFSNNGWLIASDFDYTHYGNRPDGYNTTVFLITPSIAKQFLKNKAGELRLSCFDLLDQNKAVTVTSNANQVVNTISNNLTRYVMLTFTYNLRSFGAAQQGRGQQQNQMRGMMPGGMMMDGMRMGGGNNGGGGGRRGN